MVKGQRSDETVSKQYYPTLLTKYGFSCIILLEQQF